MEAWSDEKLLDKLLAWQTHLVETSSALAFLVWLLITSVFLYTVFKLTRHSSSHKARFPETTFISYLVFLLHLFCFFFLCNICQSTVWIHGNALCMYLQGRLHGNTDASLWSHIERPKGSWTTFTSNHRMSSVSEFHESIAAKISQIPQEKVKLRRFVTSFKCFLSSLIPTSALEATQGGGGMVGWSYVSAHYDLECTWWKVTALSRCHSCVHLCGYCVTLADYGAPHQHVPALRGKQRIWSKRRSWFMPALGQ